MIFKRLNNKYIKIMNDLDIKPQPVYTATLNNYKITKMDQIDLIAVNSYGNGNEGNFSKIAYKNADVLLAWDLDNTYINSLNIPSVGSY
jgi:hypothetical protein